MDSPSTPWRVRHVLFWALLANLALWWQGSSVIRFFRPNFTPPGHGGLFIPDCFQEWASARSWTDGDAVYARHEVTVPHYLGLPFDPDDKWAVQVNAHPPTAVLLGLPFARLDFATAFLAWNVLSLAALLVCLLLIADGLGIPYPAWSLMPAVALLAVCFPFWHHMVHGNINLVLLLLLTGAWRAGRGGRPYLAGSLLGAAVAVKLFPGFLLVYFLARREWKSVFATAAAFVMLTLLTLALLGPEAYRAYLFDVMPEVSGYRRNWLNLSLAGFSAKLFDPDPRWLPVPLTALYASPALAVAAYVAAAGVLAALVARAAAKANTRADADHAFGLAVFAMVQASPLAWEHYALLLPLPLASIWRRLPRAEWAWWVFWPSAAVLCLPPGGIAEHLMTLFGVERGQDAPAGPLVAVVALSLPTLAQLALFGLGVYLAGPRRSIASEASEPVAAWEPLLPASPVAVALLLGGVLTVGLLPRLHGLEDRTLWFDEAFSWRLVSFPWPEMLDRLTQDNNPPLYFVLLKLWVGIFGSTHLALRSLSVLLGLLTTGGAYVLTVEALADGRGQRPPQARETGLLFAALVALSVFHIRYSWEARPYALGTALAALSSWALLRALHAPRRRLSPWLLFALFASLFAHTHNYALFSLVAQGLFALGYLAIEADWDVRRFARSPQVRYTALAAVLIVVAWLPWLPVFLKQREQVQAAFWTPPFTPWSAARLCLEMFARPEESWPASQQAQLVAADLCVLGLVVLWRRAREWDWFLLAGALVPFALRVVVTLFDTKVFSLRYFLFAHLFLLGGVATLVCRIPFRAERALLIAAALTASACGIVDFSREADLAGKPGYRGAVAYIRRHRGPGEPIVVCSPLVYPSIRYYAGEQGGGCYLYDDGREVVHYHGSAILSPKDFITQWQLRGDGPRRVWVVNISGGMWSDRRVPLPLGWTSTAPVPFPEALGQGVVSVERYAPASAR